MLHRISAENKICVQCVQVSEDGLTVISFVQCNAEDNILTNFDFRARCFVKPAIESSIFSTVEWRLLIQNNNQYETSSI